MVRVIGCYRRLRAPGRTVLEMPGGASIVLGEDRRSRREMRQLDGKRVAVEGRLVLEDRPADVAGGPLLMDPTRLFVL
jgi:hypothetical protein